MHSVCLLFCVQVFADFAPSALIPNQAVKTLQRLGEGGFGTVSMGVLNTGVSVYCMYKVSLLRLLETQCVSHEACIIT